MREPIARFIVKFVQVDRSLPEGTAKARPGRDAVEVCRVHADRMRISAERHTGPVLAAPARTVDSVEEEPGTQPAISHGATTV